MQIKIFTIPTLHAAEFEKEMNTFLRGNNVVDIEQHFVSDKNGSFWNFCIKYIPQTMSKTNDKTSRKKVDYKEVLDAATFKKFSELRVIRKKVAAEEVVPAYMVFTDEELAALSKMTEITPKAMLGIKGIGDKKVERFGAKFIAALAMEKV
jgi:superfamily II DNA helicase RecQ